MKKATSSRSLNGASHFRQAERLPISLPISIRGSGKNKTFQDSCRTRDLSRGGTSFRSGRNYRAGMKLRLRFLNLQNHPLGRKEVAAQVVRVGPLMARKTRDVAVRFTEPDRANAVFGELLRAEMRTSSALVRIMQALSPETEVESITQVICAITREAMDAGKVFLFLRDASSDVLRAEGPEPVEAAWGRGLVGQSAKMGQVVNVPRLSEEPRYQPVMETYLSSDTRSVLCVPLPKMRGTPPGVLAVLNKRYGVFTPEDEELGKAVASQVAAVLREAQLFASVRDLKNYYERILESVGTAILTFDRLGKLATINRAGSRIFGFHARREGGRHFTDLFAGRANARIASMMEDAVASQRKRTAYDARFVRRDGASRSLNLSALPLEDDRGDALGRVLVAEDITQEHRLMSTLCRYMAREVAEHVLQHREEMRLGGTRTDVTILMTDIRNFTTLSEELGPGEVVNLLNCYFPRIINVIFRHQGMVDKFIGDAILAVFGVPLSKEDNALRAVRAAIEMQCEIRSINEARTRRGERTIEMGIGVTSGTVIAGNVGSERRMDYTVIGDPVNLAARLEGLTKDVKRRILVNDRVHAAIATEIPCDALGLFEVKGKRKKVRVFAVRTAN